MYQGLGLFLGKQNTRETTAQAAGHSERSRRTRPQAWARTFRVMYGEPRLTNRQQTPAPRLKLKGAGSTPGRQTEIGDKYRCRQTPASGKCSSRVRPPGLPLAQVPSFCKSPGMTLPQLGQRIATKKFMSPFQNPALSVEPLLKRFVVRTAEERFHVVA